MKHFELSFTLQNPFEELENIFSIFNEMILGKRKVTANISVETDIPSDGEIYYLCIRLYRCKKYFSSVGIMRALKEKPNQEILKQLENLNEGLYPCFHVDASAQIITISFFDKKYERQKNTALHEQQVKTFEDFLALNFFLRKPFPELPSFLEIANRMCYSNCSVYIGISNSHGVANPYLSLNFTYENTSWHSLYINVGLLANSVDENVLLGVSKVNYICSSITNMSPVYFSYVNSYDQNHGPMIGIHVGKSFNSRSRKKIENQCKILDSIFPR